MDHQTFAAVFLALGAVLANAAAWLATDRRRSPIWKAAAFALGFGLWLALAWGHQLGGLVAAHPGHANGVALALFVVLGLPAWIARQVAHRT